MSSVALLARLILSVLFATAGVAKLLDLQTSSDTVEAFGVPKRLAIVGGTLLPLVELAVVWEMMNKSVMAQKPVIVLGDFWKPVIDRVREAESNPESPWIERQSSLIQFAGSPSKAADMLAAYFKSYAR